ncbi:hypothetical protein K456DRAFT_1819716 [Colletotrichum gloeosporioides 23]|nr:hypothetical protein K456DRAFT_1819716 [Colletotrichum gloeosporioides 23]
MAARDSTVAVVACGPVGLCAIVAAANLRTQLLFAIDSVRDRLGRAEKLQANPLNPLDVMANLQAQVEAVTEGRSADLDIEAVGRSPALKTAFEIVRSFGIFSSIGVHSQDIPWSAKEAYDKNIRLQMGRCPVRSIFSEALELLEKKQKSLGRVFRDSIVSPYRWSDHLLWEGF